MSPPTRPSAPWPRRVAITVAFLATLYAILLIPERATSLADQGLTGRGAGKQPFVWNQDTFWAELEREFLSARSMEPSAVSNLFAVKLAETETLLQRISENQMPPSDPLFRVLETNHFRLAPLAGACPGCLPQYAALLNRTRATVKRQSQAWDLSTYESRLTLYRLLFGGRMALEEVLIQLGDNAAPAPESQEVPSRTPAAKIHGLIAHSGDILLSRGNAPTSSLIACGNDFPGNFSHAALLHVDENTGKASIVEALIERGLVVTPLEEFLQETRLRLMILRLRPDLPAMVSDPQLPHRAAAGALAQARQQHVPYDFAMDFKDHRRQFCAEVVSLAYARVGVTLWMAITSISSPTLVTWLSSLGVRHFETQEPSDLEYDRQLAVVAEWRQPSAVFQSHLDDAVTNAMLSEGKPDEPLPYNLALLPIARVTKAYSYALNLLGKIGPVPEGMTATKALRASQFKATHKARKQKLAQFAVQFESTHKYAPTLRELFHAGRRP